MALAEDLLDLSQHLARREPRKPRQASLRRSVSTAYYALFHLLTREAAGRWRGSARSRRNLERAFQHRTMREVSEAFTKGRWQYWSKTQADVPVDLQIVVGVFIELQQERHVADYDGEKTWTRDEVLARIAQTQDAFSRWRSVRAQPIADDYLASLLVGKLRG